MQPPTPFGRTTFPVPASRRPRASASNPNLRSSTPGTSLPRLLAAAAAVTTSRTWVLHDLQAEDGGGGGVALLVLALFGGRIWREIMERRRDKKGKRKEIGQAEMLSLIQVGTALALACQAVAFFMAVKMIGPLRGSLLAIAGSSFAYLTKDRWGRTHSPFPLLPAMLSCALILLDAHKLHGPECLISLVTLIGLTLFLCGPWSSYLDSRSRGSRAQGGGGRLGRLCLTAATSLAVLLFLSHLQFIDSPISMLRLHAHQLVLPAATAALVSYAPVPFASTYDPKPAVRLRTPRDYAVYLLAIVVLQFFALHPAPSALDVLVLLPLVLSTVFLTAPPVNTDNSYARSIGGTREWASNLAGAMPTGWTIWRLLPLGWKPHFQTILNTESSRKIFYFLLINLAYMGVQMGYGVMTNSLGLISDAIHMFFDCLGIGVGLWASVAATWKPDGRYTFGYSRVETLSGFANGLFLILISIFIIFEAIQRIIDPPEMETRQLLLVSSVGLGINLFGMWATGGHHHHHGHSHGHGHDHGHSHTHIHHKKEDHTHGDHQHNHTGHAQDKPKMPTEMDRADLAHFRRRSSGKDLKIRSTSNGHRLNSHDDSHHKAGHSHASSHDHSRNREDGHGALHHIAAGHTSTCDGSHTHPRGDSHHSHTNGNILNGHSHKHHDEHGNERHAHAACSELNECGTHDASQSPPQHHSHAHAHDHDHDHDHDHSYIYGHNDSHGATHDHDHGHSHNHHGHSHNMRGVFLHVMADTLGSVGVIISTMMIKWTGWTVFDPIASLFIAVLIMASVVPLVIDSGRVLCLDVGADLDTDIQAALSELIGLDGLANFSAPRFWPRNEGELVGSIHIQLAASRSAVDPTRFSTPALNRGPAIYANADRVVARVEKVLKSKIKGLTELVVQVEGSEERVFCDCMTGG